MSSFMDVYNSMGGVMGGLPQGGVRPFQPSRGPMGGSFTAVPYGGGMQGMRLQPNVSFGNRERFATQPTTNTSGTFQQYMDSFNASPISQIATPLSEDTFNKQFGGQPQPAAFPADMTAADMNANMTPSFGNMGGAFGAGIGSIFNRFRNPAGFTPTGFNSGFLPTPPPPGGFRRPGALPEDQLMTLTTANPFSSGPDAQNPMLGNRFNQARMNAGMGGIASLMPPSMRPAPPGFMRPMDQRVTDNLRRLQQAFLGNMPQPTAQPNPSQFMQLQTDLTRSRPEAQRPPSAANNFLAALGAQGGNRFGGLMPQG